MTSSNRTQESNSAWEFRYDSSNRWANFVTYLVSAAITNAVVVAITVIAIILVPLVGLWLVYTYLPLPVFHIVLAVLIADIVLGIVLRTLKNRW
jgi:putative flippase GtrA